MEIRKLYKIVEDTRIEEGKNLDNPPTRVAVAAVVKNPCAGRYVEDLSGMVEMGGQLGELLCSEVIKLAGGPDRIESYGKAAVVGVNGSREHGAACTHAQFGNHIRKTLGGGRGKAVIPSTAAVGEPGRRITVPLHHREAELVRSHFDAIEVSIPDAPLPDEIVVIFAASTGGRPAARIGGLRADEIKGEDGLR